MIFKTSLSPAHDVSAAASAPGTAALSANPSSAAGRRVSPFEGGLAVLLVGLQVYVTNGKLALDRKLWYDEILTYTLATDASWSHLWRALAGGVDFNPPALYLLVQGFCAIWGETSATSLHLFALVCTLLGLWGLFATLRLQTARLVALTAVCAAWAHPELIRQSFEARFYTPWFALLAWTAYGLAKQSVEPRWWRQVLLAGLSVLLCTIHYFGVITLGLLVAAHLWSARHDWKTWCRRCWPVGAGVLALGWCYPLYQGQKTALSVPTWIDPPSSGQIVSFLSLVVPVLPLLAIGLACGVGKLVTNGPAAAVSENSSQITQLNTLPAHGLFGLLLLPIVLIVFSYVVQPALVSRYALVSLLGFAAIYAKLLTRLPGWLVGLLLVGFLGLGVNNTRAYVASSRNFDVGTNEFLQTLRRLPEKTPIVCESGHDSYLIGFHDAKLEQRCFSLDFEVGEIPTATNHRIVVRDVVRCYLKYYSRFATLTFAQMREFPSVYLVLDEHATGPGGEYQAQGWRVGRVYPGHRVYLLTFDPSIRTVPDSRP